MKVGKTLSSFRAKALLALAVVVVAAWQLVPSRAGDDPPAFHGNIGQFTLIRPLRPAPLRIILDAKGRELNLTRFRGRVVLLNFWATWCGPCIREMPALDRLQAELGGDRFVVVALSIDRRGAAIAAPFLARHRLSHLDLYIDPRRTSYRAFGVQGLPTTYLIDAEGTVRGYLEGAAEWDSRAARKLIRYYIDRAIPKPPAPQQSSTR